jgi:hypothetical protein
MAAKNGWVTMTNEACGIKIRRDGRIAKDRRDYHREYMRRWREARRFNSAEALAPDWL